MIPTPDVFTTVINGYLPDPHAALLNGLLFGIPLKGVPTFYEEVRNVGLLHLVVLSGTNITFLASGVAFFTRNFGKHASLLITILMIIFFILSVGPQAPIVRAGIMGILTFVAIMFGRRSYAWYALFLSFLLIAVFQSEWLISISLYLSYGATAGILLFAGKNGTLNTENNIGSYIRSDLRTSLAAQAFTVPIIAFSFNQVSLIGPLANVLVAFTIPPLMLFGFLASFLGKIHGALGLIPAYLCYGLLTYDIMVISLLSRVPFASLTW